MLEENVIYCKIVAGRLENSGHAMDTIEPVGLLYPNYILTPERTCKTNR